MRNRLARELRRAVQMAVVATMIYSAAPVAAFAVNEKPLDRDLAIKRAQAWAKRRVPYSQRGYWAGYRRDCSGFISMAWDLPENLVTWNIPLVAKRISKNELQPGDVLLNHGGGGRGRHVVMFERWADKKRTKYIAIEQTGQSGVDSTIRRTVPYPYRFDKRRYKPYRYVGMTNYYRRIPAGQRQTVRGYKGRVETPQMAASRAKAAEKSAAASAAERAEAQRAAEEARMEAVRQQHLAANTPTLPVRDFVVKASEPQGIMGRLIKSFDTEPAR